MTVGIYVVYELGPITNSEVSIKSQRPIHKSANARSGNPLVPTC
jgi:hypothetical protein